jgi:hypothetical protein
MSDGNNGFDRRTFLKAMGLTGASCFLPSLSSRFGGPAIAQAATPNAAPRRVIFLLCELGWNPYEFRMKPPGAPDDVLLPSAYHPDFEDAKDERSWDFYLKDVPRDQFSPTLKPLYDLREYTTAIDGLGMMSIGLEKYGDGHARGMLHAMSGHPAAAPITAQKSMGAVPSVDQRIAEHLRATESGLSDLTSQHLMLDKWWSGQPSDGGFHQYVYASAPEGARKVAPTTNPNDVYDRLFGGGLAEGNPVGDAQKDVLSALNDRYGSVKSKVGRQDQNKLEQHRQRIADIQERLNLLDQAACTDPGAPATSDDNWHEVNREAMFNLIVSSMSCDLTRVATVRISNQAQQARFGASADKSFHEYYSHGTWPQAKWLDGGEKREKWDGANMVLAEKNRVQCEYVAQLANMLKDTPDVDGNTMLDNTLIVMMEEISHGGHGHDQWPVVMCGGFGGAIRPGRYIRLPRIHPKPGRVSGMGQYAGKPHSHLLISIAQAMGVPLNHLGVKSVRGRADGKNHSISLTGPLHELL